MIWTLDVTISGNPIRRLRLDISEVFVGRSMECHIHLPAESVSRRHLRLAPAVRYVALEDLGSTNGTYLRNMRVTRAVLYDNDAFCLGPYICFVRQKEEDPSLSAVSATLVRLGEQADVTGVLDEEVRRRVQQASSALDETVTSPGTRSPLRR
jgi:pSer/pThr/pTyr-binding forkhead associated (FHA) protein